MSETASGLFGGNSDGMVHMCEWLDVMCRGCRRERAGDREEIGGGSGCPLVSRAIGDPYGAEMPEWSQSQPWPGRFTGQLDPRSPWPVCTSYSPRARRCDAGLRRGPRAQAGQQQLPGLLLPGGDP